MEFVYDYDKLLELMKNFHIITGIKTVLFDHKLKTVAAVPYEECAFCSALSKVPNASKKCHESTVAGCILCKNYGRLNIYKCHAGLIEAVTPIRFGDIIVGYMMMGQILDKTVKETKADEIISYASEYIGKDAKLYFSSLVCKNDEEIKAASKIMESCVCDLLMNHTIKEETGRVAFEIARYIENHLSEHLSVKVLCESFKISRNTLYRIADTYLGMPIAEYIRKKRIEKAEELIKSGMAVTEVSEALNFCDYGYFGKVFKAVTGKKPTDIKKAR